MEVIAQVDQVITYLKEIFFADRQLAVSLAKRAAHQHACGSFLVLSGLRPKFLECSSIR